MPSWDECMSTAITCVCTRLLFATIASCTEALACLSVVGITDGGGNLHKQYTYAPYGECLVAETVTGSVLVGNRVGFQGMFIDVQGVFQTNRNVIPGPRRHYLTANRVYDPPTGRWLQRDPNETAQPIVEALAVNGQAWSLIAPLLALDALYGDGMSLYQFALANPAVWRDPSGLSADDWDLWVDDAAVELIGSTLATLHSITQKITAGIKWTGDFLLTAIWALLPGSEAVDLAGKAARDEEIDSFEALSAAASVVPGGKAASLLGKTGRAFRAGRAAYRTAETLDELWKGKKVTKWLADHLGIDRHKLGEVIEKIKKLNFLGPADNVSIDLDTGDVFDNFGEWVGNVYDDL